MSAQAIADAFDARLGTFPTKIAVQYEDVAYTPVAGKPYLSARLLSYNSAPITSGPTPVMQESGTYLIQVNWPSGEGRQAAGQVADKLVGFFLPSTFMPTAEGQSVTILYASSGPGMAMGDWYSVPVTVSWMATSL